VVRLSYAVLVTLLDNLFDHMVEGRLTVEQHEVEQDQLLAMAGWTWEQVADEVDRDWSGSVAVRRPIGRC